MVEGRVARQAGVAMAGGTGAVFDAAAEDFARWADALWDPAGELLVDVADPVPGETVLDVCCGAGGSALPAARRGGRVTAVDLSERLLGLLRERAAGAGLDVRPVCGDALDPAVAPAPAAAGYDVVLCGYGVFFFPDLDAGGRALLRRLRPGGRLVVGTWAAGAVEPVVSTFQDALEPALPERVARWRADRGPVARIETPERLAGWLHALGGAGVSVVESRGTVPLTPERGWALVTGSGTRALLDLLPVPERDGVRERFLAALPDRPLVVDTLVGVARRPAAADG